MLAGVAHGSEPSGFTLMETVTPALGLVVAVVGDVQLGLVVIDLDRAVFVGVDLNAVRTGGVDRR